MNDFTKEELARIRSLMIMEDACMRDEIFLSAYKKIQSLIDNHCEYEPINGLKELLKIQCYDGNWNYDAYMYGLANGMILSLATIERKTPEFLAPPKEWVRKINPEITTESSECKPFYF